MKTILAILLLTALLARASQLGLVMVKQPLFLEYSASGNQIEFVDVPVVMFTGGAERLISAIGMPFVPPATDAWRTPHDINLASRYGIKVEALEKSARNMVVTIDASKASVPKGCGFTITQVTDAVTTCVKLMNPTHPDGTLTINVTPPAAEKKQEAAEKPQPRC